MKHKPVSKTHSEPIVHEENPEMTVERAQYILDALMSNDLQLSEEERSTSASDLATQVINVCKRINIKQHGKLFKALRQFIGMFADKGRQSEIFKPIRLLTQKTQEDEQQSMFESVRNNLVQLLTETLVSSFNMTHQESDSTLLSNGTKGNNSHTTVSYTPTTVSSHIFQTDHTHTSEAYHKSLTEFRRMSKAVMQNMLPATQKKPNKRSVNPINSCILCMLVSGMVIDFTCLYSIEFVHLE